MSEIRGHLEAFGGHERGLRVGTTAKTGVSRKRVRTFHFECYLMSKHSVLSADQVLRNLSALSAECTPESLHEWKMQSAVCTVCGVAVDSGLDSG